MNPSKRRRARRYAVQALYQWQLTANHPQDVYQFMLDDVNSNKTDLNFFEELVFKVPEQVEVIDEALTHHLDRALSEVDPVELAILRLATYEMLNHIQTPYKVIINEAVEQTKTFGAEEAHKFVNGVLDKASKELRATEVQANKKA